MVRVISVHHFANQEVQTVEQPTACALAPPSRLLLALASHCVEVRDLSTNSDIAFSFPTVDEVSQIIHCLNGDYVATLETKFNRQNRRVNFVRVYVNWDSVATLQQSKMTNSGVSLGSSECGMVQPMRARIAGRVTPTTNQSELGSLEMIEIPTKENPDSIACCQTSGNILIQSGHLLFFNSFSVKSHDISKLRFVDFEELGISIELNFSPTLVDFCENYVGCMNDDSLHLFKVVLGGCRELGAEGDDESFTFIYQDDGPLDYKKLLKEENLNLRRDKMTVNLPTIVKENSAVHKFSPFTFPDKEMTATVKPTAPIESKSSFEIRSLLQLKLKPILIESGQKQVTEEFKTLVLKPLYVDKAINKMSPQTSWENKFLKSEFRQGLNSVTCLVATQQEGYLYQFCDSEANGKSVSSADCCVAVYPFTAPVQKILLEDYFLHALTETGLETYTLRIGHQLCRTLDVIDDSNVACPPVKDPVCLVGLRPFLGVEQMLLSDEFLVLLANADSSPTHSVSSNSSSTVGIWTSYALQLPSPTLIFNDVSIVANAHRFTSAQTYRHLMSEAHMILRMSLLLKRFTSVKNNNVALASVKKTNSDECVGAYRTSCALLADHFILCQKEKDYTLAVPYYKMAVLTPPEVLKRARMIQDQANNHNTQGLLHYLKTILLDLKFGHEADKFFNFSSKQNFAEAILELFERHNYAELPYLVLRSPILREYSTDKIISVLENSKQSSPEKKAEKNLALVLLHVQRLNTRKAEETLEDIPKESLYGLLSDNWDLLLEANSPSTGKTKGSASLSELAVLMMTSHSDILAELFSSLMSDGKTLSLHKLLKIFLDYLPSSIGSDGTTASKVLQKTLELHFKRYFAKQENLDLPVVYDRPTHEAMKLLVRSYLSQLQLLQVREKNTKIVNSNHSESTLVENTQENRRNKQENMRSKQENTQGKQENTGRKQENTGSKQENTGSKQENTESKQENTGSKQENTQSKQEIQPKTQEKQNKEESKQDTYLFGNLRLEYLDKMPPFQVEITSKMYETLVDDYVAETSQPDEEADLILKKLQALFCSQVIPKQVLVEANAFLSLNPQLRGNSSLKSLIMNVNDAIIYLVDVCPQCILQFGKDRFTKSDEWKFLIATVQRRILRLSQNEDLKRICFFHKKLLKDILTHIATAFNLDQLVQVFPQRLARSYGEDDEGRNDDEDDVLCEIQNYEPYIVMCKETMHANQIKKLITATGQQLLCTLNL